MEPWQITVRQARAETTPVPDNSGFGTKSFEPPPARDSTPQPLLAPGGIQDCSITGGLLLCLLVSTSFRRHSKGPSFRAFPFVSRFSFLPSAAKTCVSSCASSPICCRNLAPKVSSRDCTSFSDSETIPSRTHFSLPHCHCKHCFPGHFLADLCLLLQILLNSKPPLL